MSIDLWSEEQTFFSGDQYYAAIILDIQKAKKSIYVESYIFDFDEVGQNLAQFLVAAVLRGVRVQVIVDGFGSISAISTLQHYLSSGGVQLKVFHPILSSWFIPIFRNINRRNHRKVWIFDDTVAYAGSFNISKVHTSFNSKPWRDSGIRVEGEDVQLLTEAFHKVWNKKKVWSRKIFNFDDLVGSPLVRLNDGKNKRRVSYRDLLFRIREAKKYICFGNAYFAPHFRLVMELCYSARRGVEVHLLVPRQSDIFFMPWVSSTYYFALLQSGVKIHEYLPAVFHAKNYVIDDWMMIGSSNLNYRSLFHDLEVDLQVTRPENKEIFLKEINEDIKKSELVTLASFEKISWFRKIIANFFLLFKSWM